MSMSFKKLSLLPPLLLLWLSSFDLRAQESAPFHLGAAFKSKFYEQKQSGVLGETEIRTFFFHNISTFTQYQRGSFKIYAQLDHYPFNYQFRDDQDVERSLSSAQFRVYFQNFFLGFQMEQLPLFRDTPQDLEIKVLTELALPVQVGFQQSWAIPSLKESSVSAHIVGKYFFKSFTSDQNVSTSQMKGFACALESKIKRRLEWTQNMQLPLFFFWSNGGHYQHLKRDIAWAPFTGEIKTESLDFSSSIGLQAQF